jgi:hypothetical protein
MDRDELALLADAIDRSIEMRQALRESITGNAAIDLVEEWAAIERLDHEIARMIRKRPPE